MWKIFENLTGRAREPEIPPGAWRTVEIQGKAADVFEPGQPRAELGAVLFLHGHGQVTLRENAVYTAELNRRGLRTICPHGGPSWWVDRVCVEFDPVLTPEQHLLTGVIPWIAETWHISPPYLALLGVSMGGQGALRFAHRYGLKFPTVAALSPIVDFHLWYGQGWPLDRLYPTAEAARQDTATLHIHPLAYPRNQFILCDPTDLEAIDGTQRLFSKLSSSGILFESDVETSHGGHGWNYFNHQAPRVLDWIVNRLEAEHLRLP